MELKQCKKQTTIAIIMKDNKFISFGSNSIKNNVKECPKKGIKTKKKYELCKTVCNQPHHTKINACNTNENINKTTLYLINHTYYYNNYLITIKKKNKNS